VLNSREGPADLDPTEPLADNPIMRRIIDINHGVVIDIGRPVPNLVAYHQPTYGYATVLSYPMSETQWRTGITR
jgi:hypothetical protein